MDKDAIEKHVAGLLKEFGVDLNDANFRDTPARVARMYEEIFRGLHANASMKVAEIMHTAFPAQYEGMVIITGITAWGMCPHHLLPVEYKVDVGYIPNKKVLGLSKLPRLVQLLAAQPVMQETYTQDITQTLHRFLVCKGAMAVVVGSHLCMRMRGVRAEESLTTTSSITGVFETDSAAKQEFLNLRSIGSKQT